MPIRKSKRKQLSISIIGAGRLGTALALALQDAEYTVVAAVTRSRKGSARLKNTLGDSIPRLTAKQLSFLPVTDVILISTPDDEIELTAQKLSRATIASPTTVLHTSGALSSAALQPLADLGISTGSLHPLVSVSEPHAGAKALRGSFFCIEGTPAAREVAQQLVRDLQGKSFSVRTNRKALYHASAVMASGHVVALLDLATEMLAKCGLSRPEARKVLAPLVQSTLDNLKTSDSARALTGTFARGDRSTVKQHLEALDSVELADALAAYLVLGRHALSIAKGGGADRKRFKEIEALLKTKAKAKANSAINLTSLAR